MNSIHVNRVDELYPYLDRVDEIYPHLDRVNQLCPFGQSSEDFNKKLIKPFQKSLPLMSLSFLLKF